MPLTKLDDNFALVVIDLQKGITASPTVHPAADIVRRSAQLARAFRDKGQPVVLVNVTGVPPGRTDSEKYNTASFPPDWAELVPELDQQPEDCLITKRCVDAFIGTSLHEVLRQRGVTQVFVTGISTSVGVESTVRSAYDHGYNVVTVIDAVTDRNPEAHRHSVETIFPRRSETTTTDNVLKLLTDARA